MKFTIDINNRTIIKSLLMYLIVFICAFPVIEIIQHQFYAITGDSNFNTVVFILCPLLGLILSLVFRKKADAIPMKYLLPVTAISHLLITLASYYLFTIFDDSGNSFILYTIANCFTIGISLTVIYIGFIIGSIISRICGKYKMRKVSHT